LRETERKWLLWSIFILGNAITTLTATRTTSVQLNSHFYIWKKRHHFMSKGILFITTRHFIWTRIILQNGISSGQELYYNTALFRLVNTRTLMRRHRLGSMEEHVERSRFFFVFIYHIQIELVRWFYFYLAFWFPLEKSWFWFSLERSSTILYTHM